MSILSSFKRVSISSTKSAKSSNCSVPVNGNPAPQGITNTFELNIQSSSPVVSCASPTSGCAEMLEDENMSWGTARTSSSRHKHSKRRSIGFF